MWAEATIRCKKDVPDEYIYEWFGETGNVREILKGTEFEELLTDNEILDRIVYAQLNGTIAFVLLRVSKREFCLHIQDRLNKTSLVYLKRELKQHLNSIKKLLKKHSNKEEDIGITIYAEGELVTMGRSFRPWPEIMSRLLFRENLDLEIATTFSLVLINLWGGHLDQTLIRQLFAVIGAFVIVLGIKAWREQEHIIFEC